MVTSYLAADMFFRCDDLVHVGSQSGVQWSSLGLTGFNQCLKLSTGLRQHLPVHGIRDLEERVVQVRNWTLCLQYSMSTEHSTVQYKLTSIQFLCLCCSFPFSRGPIVFFSSGVRVSITRLAKICTQIHTINLLFLITLIHFDIYLYSVYFYMPENKKNISCLIA